MRRHIGACPPVPILPMVLFHCLSWGCGSIDVVLYSENQEFSNIFIIDSASFDCSAVQSCSIVFLRSIDIVLSAWKQRKRPISLIDSDSLEYDGILKPSHGFFRIAQAVVFFWAAFLTATKRNTALLRICWQRERKTQTPLRSQFYWYSSIFGKSGIPVYFYYWSCFI